MVVIWCSAFVFFCARMALLVLVLVDCDLDDCGLCRDRLDTEVV